ncbi:MAG: oxidoreductase [Pirellulaceae bacterium]|jgi:NAD(P)-dependent dehydrogenase (short-subunit alcohol dehydrogenase family)|nr:oxidoreductase [Pirellulaceae bacterium]
MGVGRLNSKVVILVGGNGRLGQAVASAVVKAGGRAVVASRSGGIAADILAQLDDGERDRVDSVQADAICPQAIDRLFSEVIEKNGRCDAIVNLIWPRNKGFGTAFENVKYEDFIENVSTNLGGTFLVCQRAAAAFIEQGYGNIVNVSSIYGVMAPRFQIYEGTGMTTAVEYAVVKPAIIHLTRYLAQYLKGHEIRVNCVSPGGILDNQPASFLRRYNAFGNSKGMLDASDVSGTLVFLLSDESRHITGQNIVVDDGFSL